MNIRNSEQERIVLEALRAGLSGREAARKANLSPSSVSNIARYYGIKPTKGRRPTCEIDHAAFDVLTEESEYWTGFLCADGCFTPRSNGSPQIILSLSEKDRAHVLKFRTFCKSTHAVTNTDVNTNLPHENDSEPRKAVSVRFRSEPIYNALKRYGIADVKGPLRCPSAEIENSRHFWRGCIDGDGSIGLSTDKRRGYIAPYLILCGHKPLLKNYQCFLESNGISSNITNTSSGIYQVRISNTPAKTAIRIIYDRAMVALDRKWTVAKTIMER